MSQDLPKQKIRLTFSAGAEKFVRSSAPRESRLAAARGAVPLDAPELATVLFALMHDADTEIRARAETSLTELPESVCMAVLKAPVHAALLSRLAHIHKENESRLEALILNPATDDATIAFVAGLAHPRLIEIISENQQRMLRHEAIVEALGRNPLTGRATIERILGFLDLEGHPQGGYREPNPSTDADPALAERALLALLGKNLAHVVKELAREEGSEGAKQRVSEGNLFAAVQKMSVIQKVKLARLGGRDARSLLVRDRNKVVASAVVMSPKITESEIVAIAQSRNVAEEILRRICNNRDWTRRYAVKQALTLNPKTPQTTAVEFLNHLHERDLRSITRSRDVPSAISAHARRVLQRKEKI